MDRQHKIDAIFTKAKLVPVSIPFTETKDLFITTLETGKTVSTGKVLFFNFKNILIMIGIVSILSLVITLSITSENNSTPTSKSTALETEKVTLEKNKSIQKLEATNTYESQEIRKLMQEISRMKLIPISSIGETHDKRLMNRSEQTISFTSRQNQPRHDNNSRFPKLTDKEIAANHKQKKKMIKALSKFDRKKYAYVPSGSYTYKSTPVSVQAFFIQQDEVTNLEYRTFIFDLLIQGRKKEFLLAAPNQTLWTTELDDSLKYLQDDYFSDPLYNQHPVVNITQEGAKMYCDWITIETNKTRGTDPINDARIPELLEWTYAASGLGTNQMFPWNGEKLAEEGTFKANFKLSEYNDNLDEIKRKTKSKDTGRTTFEYTNGLLIAQTRSYKPSGQGLYHMSGNVAEMVSTKLIPGFIEMIQPDENQLVTCGGSWMSSIEDLQIFNENYSNHVNGHPSIGFRIVVTHTGRFN